MSWNTSDHLDACLAALPTALGDLVAHVVVVDNASSDDSVAVATRHGAHVIVNNTNQGYAVAMNQALTAADAPLLLALNPDTVPGPGSVADLVTSTLDHPNAGVIVPRLIGADGNQQYSAYRFPGPVASMVAALSNDRIRRSRLGRNLLLEGSGPYETGVVDWAIGAVHLIRRSALGEEAPYSERSFMYAEDLDLCWRLTQRGAPTVLIGDVTITHIGNVAGALAWGDERSRRYWAATYDVIAQRTSRLRVRWMALWCSIAAIASIIRSTRKKSGRSRDRARRLRQIRLRELRVHTAALCLGPPPPPTNPPAASA